MTTAIFIDVTPIWESPRIRKGSTVRKFWKYQHRIDRLCRLPAGDMMVSIHIGGLVMDTMEYCEELGYSWEEDEEGCPVWSRQ